MVDLIFALTLIVVVVLAAESVRASCRRSLARPVRTTPRSERTVAAFADRPA